MALAARPNSIRSGAATTKPFLRRRRNFDAYPEGADVPERAGISLGGARSLDAGRTEAWRSHLPRIRAQLDAYPAVAGKLIELGYEVDDGWRTALDGVEPLHQDYRKDDPPHRFRELETRLRFWWKTRRYLQALRARPTHTSMRTG